MVSRIEIGFLPGVRDALGEKTRRRIVHDLHLSVESVETIEVYSLEGDLADDFLERIAAGPLSDPVIQRYAVNSSLAERFDWLIEVGFRPGVTDNVGRTATEAVQLLLEGAQKGALKVYTSRQYLLKGKLNRQEVEDIASGLLANDLIQRFEIVDGRTWQPGKSSIQPYVPRVIVADSPRTDTVELPDDDARLQEISSSRVLALTVEEMRILRNYFQDEAVQRRRREVGLGEGVPVHAHNARQGAAVGIESGRRVMGLHLEDQIIIVIELKNSGVIHKDGKTPVLGPQFFTDGGG